MALSNYTELQAAVASWLGRTDLAVPIVDAIRLAGAEISRRVNYTEVSLAQTLAIGIGSDNATLPANFRRHGARVRREPQPARTLTQVPLSRLIEFRLSEQSDGPNYFAILGNRLMIAYETGAALNLTCDFWARLPQLSGAQATNWALDNGPDAYLYGALKEMEPYLKNDPRVQTWLAKFETALAGLQEEANSIAYGDAPAAVVPAMEGP